MSVIDLILVVVATTGVVTFYVVKNNIEKLRVRVKADKKSKK